VSIINRGAVKGIPTERKKELVGEAMAELQGFGGPLDENVFEVHNLFWVIGGGGVWIVARSE
jgi:hypothetical protein